MKKYRKKTNGVQVDRFEKVEKKQLIGHAECERSVGKRKVSLPKGAEKIYTVTVTYVRIKLEEAKTKRALIEGIIRKGVTRNPPGGNLVVGE